MSNLFEGVDSALEKLRKDFKTELEKQIEEGFQKGFEVGRTAKRKPTIAEFRKFHAEPLNYGEDYAMVVWARSVKQAAKLLETDPERVEEMYVGWGAYRDDDGDMQIGYVLNRRNDGEYEAYGIWL